MDGSYHLARRITVSYHRRRDEAMKTRRTQKNSAGVTLVEVMMASVIILIVSLACVQVMQSNAKSTSAVFNRIQASQILDQIHNQLHRSNVAALEQHYNQFPQILADTKFSADVFIATATVDGIRVATITVAWNSNEQTISSVVTLVP